MDALASRFWGLFCVYTLEMMIIPTEFWARFHILDNIPIHLIDDETLSSADQPNKAIYFTKEQFVAGLRLPLPSLFKQFLHFTKIPLAFVHQNVVRVLMGYSVLDMLFQLDISLLEVLQEKVGHLVEWVEKDSFTRLNKLFKIDVSERNHNVLLSDKNLMVLINDPKPFIIPVFPHVAFPSLVANEHFVLKDLSFYEVVRLADSKARQTRLEVREKKPSNSEPKVRFDRVVPPITCEDKEKEKEYMASNLRVGFREREAPMQDMGMLFSTTQWIPVEIDNDPSRSFTTRFSYGTLDFAISRIMPMQDYTTFQMAEVLFYQLEATETMRAYIAHNMDGSEDLRTNLETMKSEVVAYWKLVEEGTSLLRKVEEEKEAVQTNTRRLAEEKDAMAADKEKAEEKVTQLRQELQNLQAGFTTQKEALEADYQKQIDDMFFYYYQCCIKKHGITQDTPSFFSDDEDEVLDDPTQGRGDASGANLFSEQA
uniref:Uncharacterized protein n=1 Tax=Vitis vinifera TaxID=29760 RepID=A5BJA9_VITVI|nr:hypothetical protein VITISV_005014 [Vitis vinifera]